jgi:hypothetical protein
MHHSFKSLTSSNLPEDQDPNKEVVIPTIGPASLYDHPWNKSLIKSKTRFLQAKVELIIHQFTSHSQNHSTPFSWIISSVYAHLWHEFDTYRHGRHQDYFSRHYPSEVLQSFCASLAGAHVCRRRICVVVRKNFISWVCMLAMVELHWLVMSAIGQVLQLSIKWHAAWFSAWISKSTRFNESVT